MDNFYSYSSLDKKDRTDFYIALAVIVSVLGFIVFFSFDNLFSDRPQLDINIDVIDVGLDDTINIEGVEYVHMKRERLLSNKVRVVDSEKVIVEGYISDSCSVESHSSVLVKSIDIDTISEQIETFEIIDSATIKTEMPLEDTAKYILETIEEIDSSNLEPENVIVEQSQIITKSIKDNTIDKSCLIAVGLYRKETNANKMLARLDAAGYDAFIKVRGNKRQVLVYSTCHHEKLMKALSNIRSNFASDAVVLIKK